MDHHRVLTANVYRALAGFALGASLAAYAPRAHATPTEDPGGTPAPSSDRALTKDGSSPLRTLPDYDGRPAAGVTVGEGFLWVPRVVLYPVHAVLEYGVRKPLGFVISAAERGHVPQKLYDALTWGPNENIGLRPTALVDAGFRPSVGAYFFYDDMFTKGNGLKVHAVFGGPDWLRLTVAESFQLQKSVKLNLRVEAVHRPDYVFYGLGSYSLRANRARYGSDFVDGSATLTSKSRAGITVDTYIAARTVRFRGSECCGDPSIVDLATEGRYPLPPGFVEGYTGFRAGAKLAFDTRKPRPQPGSGVRLEGSGEYGTNLRDPSALGWLRYSASAGGFLDLTGRNRVLSLTGTVAFADPFGDHEIPFTEQVQVGGIPTLTGFYQGPFVGFYPGRLIGRSAASLALEYRYPVWSFLDGTAQVGVGNVFDSHLSNFAPDRLRLAWAVGLRTSGERDTSFNILVGAGTETFEQGARLDEVRFVLGATQGF
jgi:hypothetical protein